VRVFNPAPDAGFSAGNSVVQMVNDDMSFLVDSIGMALSAHGLVTHGIVHPVFPVMRDGEAGCSRWRGRAGVADPDRLGELPPAAAAGRGRQAEDLAHALAFVQATRASGEATRRASP
jgi:hypothetical protein